MVALNPRVIEFYVALKNLGTFPLPGNCAAIIYPDKGLLLPSPTLLIALTLY